MTWQYNTRLTDPNQQGSGMSGLSAAWALSQETTDVKVTLFEAEGRPGGHSNTVSIDSIDGKETVGVDTGFIVCNPITYPNFLSFLEALGVPLLQSDMSFAVSRNQGEFEWAGGSLDAVFAQRQNLFPWTRNGGIWRMLMEILRFHKQAKDIATEADRMVFTDSGTVKNAKALDDHPLAGMTLGEFFNANDYSPFFYENYVLPMTASIWSTPAEMTFDRFPLLTLVRFMRNHVMLQIGGRPKWQTIPGGSRTYVDRVLEGLQDVRLGTPIVSVKRPDSKDIQGKVQLTDAHGHVEEFDHVIFATHTDQALKILGNDATQKEKEILGAIKYVKNRAVLHRDTSLMPRIRKTWSSWNYLTQSKMESRSQQMCLSYWMNNLQPFIKEEKFGTVIVTLNPVVEPNPDLVMQEFEYEHPLYCPETISAQDALNEIQNKNRTLFAGAWTNYGFHEDGCTSGLLAALSLGARLPFPVLLNGGYPTTRTPPSPPEYLMERKEVPVKPYVAPPPTRLSHAQDDDNTPMSLWTSLAAIAGVSSVVLWKLLY